METDKDCSAEEKGCTNGITKVISAGTLKWPEHITEIDLCNRKIKLCIDNIKLPLNLAILNISHCELIEVPKTVLALEKLKDLNISHNRIQYFDDCPNFYNVVEILNMSHNNLYGPPYWVWTQLSQKLTQLDLSFNPHLADSLVNGYFEELLQYKTSLTNIRINNCVLTFHFRLLDTFPNAKVLELGSDALSLSTMNRMTEVPCNELVKCIELERLDLSNTKIYTIKTNIDVFTSLVEINLSQNYITSLPDEICNLSKLEVCILSHNQLLYLPDGIGRLRRLASLQINSNEVCMLPESIKQLENLKVLDLYDNSLYEIPNEIKGIAEIDLAQNYFEEPEELEYLERKGRLRLNLPQRYNGKKIYVERVESERSYDSSDAEVLQSSSSINQQNLGNHHANEPPSSPEDWDSDDYWVPRFYKSATPQPHSPWLYFVKRKMAEGNFCPMDAHPVPIAEKVRYEKLCRPQVKQESDEQFNDWSDDNS